MDNSAAGEPDDIINPDKNPDVEEVQNPENESARYWQDCHQLLTLLPKEVWDHICTFLNSQDFQNLTNSSLFFRELFLRKRIFLLYPPVLNILIPKLENYLETPSSDYHEDVRGVLLECRDVCRTWKRSIDKQACILTPEDSRTKNLVQYLLAKNYTFKDSREIDNFLKYFQGTHPPSVNPSPAKYIDLHIRLMEEDYPQLLNKITLLLEKYGQHIQTFEISIMFGFENPPELHRKIVNWLNCMPNLQNLLIYCFVPLRSDIVAPVNLEILPSRLVALRKLELGTFVPPLADEHIPEWSWMERYNLSRLVTLNDNLNFLKITIFNKNDVKILETVTSPLETLVVQYYFKENDVKLSEVFNMLSDKFKETLENLRICFRVNNKPSAQIKVIWDCMYGRLNLPKVRKFEMKILRMYCVDFLLGMKENLEELIVDVSGSLGRSEYTDFSEVERGEIGLIEGNQIIKFMGYQNNMLESNIWSLFPKLKVIRLSGSDGRKEFKRKDWSGLDEFN